MEVTAVSRGSNVAQWYGYAVCLIAVVTILISLNTIVENGFILSDPLRAGGGYEPALTSFEAYQATLDRRPVPQPGADTVGPKTSEADLRRRFDALRSERIAQRRFDATKSLVTSAVLLVVAGLLFVWHWIWLRRNAAEIQR